MQDILGGWLHQERKKIYTILKKKSLKNNKRVTLKSCNTLATSSSLDKYDKSHFDHFPMGQEKHHYV